ncbi:D-tyrosyl-tRNA deacylase [Gracilibacillus boraciitolerans JCM 21714]|uniref:D-aminoacyl-tRNA deacylase n=1 Tax=Gracilibacillus boraciitolerans JCM 21714 TaxID=1298598 RepID=W4VL59_9BACI|nr:D-aminoacyl-tRNA deacylase [Gracilibacillus boraciitolerans]GAE94130.1 D-tyrosyl-tRNA deacylase [Gracilibacillus boraciitolerans JCM 21714]
MKVVLQRAHKASVSVGENIVGKIDYGYVAMIGITHGDTEEDIEYLVNKIVNLRVFEDETGKMNLSLKDVEGSILSISQFTLYGGDTRKGRRPNFMQAAKPDIATRLYESFNDKLRLEGIHVETGAFGEMMDVSFTNKGPVTIILDSIDRKTKK